MKQMFFDMKQRFLNVLLSAMLVVVVLLWLVYGFSTVVVLSCIVLCPFCVIDIALRLILWIPVYVLSGKDTFEYKLLADVYAENFLFAGYEGNLLGYGVFIRVLSNIMSKIK